MANKKRLIDANALIAKAHEEMFEYEADQFEAWISWFDTVDAVEVVHGRWVDVRGIPSVNRKDVPVVKCSKCEICFCDLINNHHYMYHYCPNCGAKMDGGNEDENS